jgi:SAM-dependent methyltransferase
VIPWRVKNFISDRFPLLYHLAVNGGLGGNAPEHWDNRLEQTWDWPVLQWPTKNDLIASRTSLTDRILDVGCGNGTILKFLRAQGYQYLTGLEGSRYAVDRLRSEQLDVCQGPLLNIPLPDESYDVVIASQVLEHIIRRGRFAKEVRRLLKPKGRAFFFVPDNVLGPIDEPEHVAKYTRDSLNRFLSRYFRMVTVESLRDRNHDIPILLACAQKA